VWKSFNDMVKMFFDSFAVDTKLTQSQLASEVTALVKCCLNVGLTHDKLVDAFRRHENFEENIGEVLSDYRSSGYILPNKGPML
jgi:hypothetical protein